MFICRGPSDLGVHGRLYNDAPAAAVAQSVFTPLHLNTFTLLPVPADFGLAQRLTTPTPSCPCCAACTSAPSTPLANGAFPTTCANTPAGGVCRGVCNTDFAGQPVVGCIADPQSPTGASWATAANGSCVPGKGACVAFDMAFHDKCRPVYPWIGPVRM